MGIVDNFFSKDYNSEEMKICATSIEDNGNRLWRFFWDCGRRGEIEGLFVATEEEVNNIVGKFVYFGEVLGRHSDIYGPIECGEILQIDAPIEFIHMGREIFGKTWSGYNPFNFLEEEDELNEKLSSVRK